MELAPIQCEAPNVSQLCTGVDVQVKDSIVNFTEHFADSQSSQSNVNKEAVKQQRTENAADMTSSFYSLVTDFYEYGYGSSFHFAPIHDGLSFAQNIQQYQHELAKLVQAKPGMKLLVSPL